LLELELELVDVDDVELVKVVEENEVEDGDMKSEQET